MLSTSTSSLSAQTLEKFQSWFPLSKALYHTCHVYVPDLGERLPAICVGQKYYSFLKVVKEKQKALDIVAKLYNSGDRALITSCSKAYAIWVWEPDVSLNS